MKMDRKNKAHKNGSCPPIRGHKEKMAKHSQQKRPPMSETHKRALKKSHTKLVEDLTVDFILDEFFQAEIFTYAMVDKIKTGKTDSAKTNEFLQMLSKSEDNAFSTFLYALAKHGLVHLGEYLAMSCLEINGNDQSSLSFIRSIKTREGMERYGQPKSTPEQNYFSFYSSPADYGDMKTDSEVSSKRPRTSESTKFVGEIVLSLTCRQIFADELPYSVTQPNRACQIFTTDQSLYLLGVSDIERRATAQISKGEYVIAEKDNNATTPAIAPEPLYEVPSSQKSSAPFKEPYVFAYCSDQGPRAFWIPDARVKGLNDPNGEPWYFPTPITSTYAHMLLGKLRQEGCFVVYENEKTGTSNAKTNHSLFNLSVYSQDRNTTSHYRIVQNRQQEFYIAEKDNSEPRTFHCLKDLVKHFQQNKGRLVTRLRRPLEHAKKVITPGADYDSKWEINTRDIAEMKEVRHIGKGNFGKVICMLHKDRPVAVKTTLREDPETHQIDDFLAEAKILMKMKGHENILELVGVVFAEEPHRIVTVYHPKGSLRDNLHELNCQNLRNPKIINILLKYVADIARAMKQLSDARYIIHRDLAARNCLVSTDNRAILADFGKAVYVEENSYRASGSEMIACRSASKEVIEFKTYSTASDVWAFAVLVWEVFSLGKTPYENKRSAKEVMDCILDNYKLPKPKLCPSSLYQLMENCWSKDSKKRPSFEDIVQDLAIIQSQHSAQESGPSSRAPRRSRSRRWFICPSCCSPASSEDQDRSEAWQTEWNYF